MGFDVSMKILCLFIFRDESSQSITCTVSDNQTRADQGQNTYKHKIMQRSQSGSSEQHKKNSNLG